MKTSILESDLKKTFDKENFIEFPLWLLFFDGEEAFGRDITEDDGLYGSRALADRMQRDGSLGAVHAFLVVDMVGDRDLNLTPDVNSAPWLATILVDEARRISPELIDERARVGLVDDHTPFREAGLEDTLALIDFQFGARTIPGPLWHAAGDDLDAVASESLNKTGRLLVEIVQRLEAGAPGLEDAADQSGP